MKKNLKMWMTLNSALGKVYPMDGYLQVQSGIAIGIKRLNGHAIKQK